MLVFGKVTRVEWVGTTSMANGIGDVTLSLVDGTEETFRTSANTGLVYGIENPEYREHVHAFELTPAGRITSEHHTATAAWRSLADIDRVATLVTRHGASTHRVRVLVGGADGDVIDVSWSAALVTQRKRADDGAIVIRGIGTDPASHLVYHLSSALGRELAHTRL